MLDGTTALTATIGALLSLLAGLTTTFVSGSALTLAWAGAAVGVVALGSAAAVAATRARRDGASEETALKEQGSAVKAVTALAPTFTDQEHTLADAPETLSMLPSEPGQSLVNALRSRDPAVRRGSLVALGLVGDARSTPAIIDALADEDLEVRLGAIWALAVLGHASSTEAISWTLKDPNRTIREASAEALRRVGVMLVRRKRWEPEFVEAQEQLASAWAQLDRSRRSHLAEAGGRRSSDYSRLLTDLISFSSAPVADIERLAKALGLELDAVQAMLGSEATLGRHEQLALEQAAQEFGWDALTVFDLAARAGEARALGGVQRLKLTSVEDWLRLRVDLVSRSFDE